MEMPSAHEADSKPGERASAPDGPGPQSNGEKSPNAGFSKLSIIAGKLSSLSSHVTFAFVALLIICAVWQSFTPVTIIAPFQVPQPNLPFNGEIVADALQDGLTSIHDDIETEKEDPRLRPTEMDLQVLRGLNIPKFRVQDSSRFEVELKGFSYGRIVSAARSVWHNQTTISGDLIPDTATKEFILIARTPEDGPWQSVPRPMTAEGLKSASRELAEQILAAQNPTLAGAALLKSGQSDQAVDLLKKALNHEKPNEHLKLNLCMGFEANRRYEDAIGCYEELGKMGPSAPQEVLEHIAHAQYLKGDREVAIESFRNLVRNGYDKALLDLGKALDDTGDHAGALKAYGEFVAKQRNKPDNRRNLAIAHVNMGAAFARQKRHDEAKKEFQDALNYAPGDVLILANLAFETAEAGDLDGGIAQLQAIVEKNVNPDSVPFAYLQLGSLLQEKGDWQGAAEQFRKATELRPNYEDAHRSLAAALAHEGLIAYALSEYAEVAKLSPVEPDHRYSVVLANQWLGNALRDQGKYPGAGDAYREAILLKHDYRLAHSELGLVLERQGHLEEAIQQYRSATMLEPSELDDKESIVIARHRLEEGLVSQGRKRRAEAIAELRRLMELDLRDLNCRFCLAKALFEEGNFRQAADEYDFAIKSDPQSPVAHHSLARALEKQGQLEKAVIEYRLAANLAPSEAIYHADLARALELQNLKQEAVAERQIVARLNSEAVVPSGSTSPLQAQLFRCQVLR